MGSMPGYAAIVLAGGAGRRLGGVDKAAIEIGDQTLLDRALDAVAAASPRVVVGPIPPQRLPVDVIGAREDPPGGGPVAAIEAGLTHVTADVVAVLACDMPLVTAELVNQLFDALVNTSPGRAADGVLLRDEDGRRQPLAALYRSAPMRRAVAALPTSYGAAVRAVLNHLELVEVPVGNASVLDCDTWESVAACRVELHRRNRRNRREQL